MKIIKAAAQVIIVISFSAAVFAHPSMIGNAHPHTTQNIRWEVDLIQDGNTAHNHADLLPFFGAETLVPPATAGACWDNRIVRVTSSPLSPIFLQGHCFVNPVALNATPTFYLSSAIPTAAKDRIRDAFSDYNEINLQVPGYILGHGIVETSSQSGANVIVQWFDLPTSYRGGVVLFPSNPLSPTTIRFDSSMAANDWDYSRSTSSVPADKWHFYSVALHEVGHVFGLGHQGSGDLDDIMNGPVGEPANSGGRQFSFVDDDSVYQIARLYTQPVAVPSEPEYQVYWQSSCWGGWDWVFTLDQVFSSGGLSYRPSASQWICWLIAVIGGE